MKRDVIAAVLVALMATACTSSGAPSHLAGKSCEYPRPADVLEVPDGGMIVIDRTDDGRDVALRCHDGVFGSAEILSPVASPDANTPSAPPGVLAAILALVLLAGVAVGVSMAMFRTLDYRVWGGPVIVFLVVGFIAAYPASLAAAQFHLPETWVGPVATVVGIAGALIWQRRNIRLRRGTATPRTSSGTAPPSAVATALRELEDLRADGLITDDEYSSKRHEVLNRL